MKERALLIFSCRNLSIQAICTHLEFHISQSNGEGAVLKASGVPPGEENGVEFFGAQVSISVLVQQCVHHL